MSAGRAAAYSASDLRAFRIQMAVAFLSTVAIAGTRPTTTYRALALGVMMIPVITRTTEELLRMVPVSLREGAYALGATRTRAMFTVVLPAALPGILTGVVLALARTAGETAPLLFTSFNNRFWAGSVTEPIASLTVQVYTYAISPYEDWHRQAWAGALAGPVHGRDRGDGEAHGRRGLSDPACSTCPLRDAPPELAARRPSRHPRARRPGCDAPECAARSRYSHSDFGSRHHMPQSN